MHGHFGVAVCCARPLYGLRAITTIRRASADSGPGDQAEKIRMGFEATCNSLVDGGELVSADVQDASNGFNSAMR